MHFIRFLLRMRKLKLPILICIFFAITLFSCNNIRQEKFDKIKWKQHEDAGQPSSHRKRMLEDLTTNYKLTEIKYSELVGLLGEPNFEDSTSLGYDIIVDYGNDIDPVYTKILKFIFSRDSIITSVKVNEWKK